MHYQITASGGFLIQCEVNGIDHKRIQRLHSQCDHPPIITMVAMYFAFTDVTKPYCALTIYVHTCSHTPNGDLVYMVWCYYKALKFICLIYVHNFIYG